MAGEIGDYCGIDFIGGGLGAVDKIDGAVLQDRDHFLVVTPTVFAPLSLDADSGAGENSPQIIAPNTNPGNKRWILTGGIFAGLTLYGNVVMPDGGTIGQAAGPLLTFDDSNNFLEITGCKVGNIATPLAALHFENSSYPVGKFVRMVTTTGGIHSGFQLLTRTSADMIDGFSGGIILSIQDNTSGEQAVARIYASRNGADNEGKLSLCAGTDGNEPFLTIGADGDVNFTGSLKVDDTQVVSNRVIDARCDDAINSGDATTDGVIDALRDAMITHGLIAAV